MDINKQLFEDVLSGKLKGTFVLRNGYTLDSKYLKRAKDTKLPYVLHNNSFFVSYTESGNWCSEKITFYLDIIDFIPNTDMNENELTIEIPDNKIVDWDESKKQNKIVLKDKQLNYRDIAYELSSRNNSGHFYIDGLGDIEHSYVNPGLINTAPSKHQLECILAKNQLANVALYLNGDWKPGERDYATCLMLHDMGNIIYYRGHCFSNGQVIFKTHELAHQAVEILGEETVKLALEPLGI